MKLYLLLIAAICVVAVVSGKRKGGKTKCERQVAAAFAAGTRSPTCTKKGKFKPKQCSDKVCWCVNKNSGKRTFGKQKVPLGHDYNCKNKPRMCLREELHILVDGTGEPLPQCDENGNYESKQCVPIVSRKCRGRYQRSPPPCSPIASYGNPPLDAAGLDQAVEWTFVLKTGFVSDGEITSFDAFVGATGKPFRVGVYRGTGILCQFTLISQLEWPSLDLGLATVEIPPADRLQVQVGDRVGFSWTASGVVKYGPGDPGTFDYCEDSELFNPLEVATLQEGRFGNRDYSFSVSADGPRSNVGHDPIERTNVDVVPVYTIVDNSPFPNNGEIRAVEFWAGIAGKDLKFGLYRGVICHPISTATVVKLVNVTGINITVGFNRIELIGADIFNVVLGDYFGITFEDGGVVMHEPSAITDYYCGDAIAPATSDIVQLPNSFKRIYSFQAEFVTCNCVLSGVPAPARAGSCDECFCVDENDGHEVPGSRSIGDVSC